MQMNIDQNRAKVGQWVSKIWGQTRCLARGHGFEVHELRIRRGGYCSRHKHSAKWNQFFVLSGTLGVRYYDHGGQEIDDGMHNIGRDCSLLVPPGQVHRFESHLSDVHCMEIYWTDPVDPDDIQRLDEGGMFTPAGMAFSHLTKG